MARKTAYENAHKTLTKPKSMKKIIKEKIWKYMFENKHRAFTVCELSKEYKEKDRKTIYEVLKELSIEIITEHSKEYKVYKTGSSFQIFDVKEYEKLLSESKTMEKLMDKEAIILNNKKMWTSDKAESVLCDVVFYPVKKRNSYTTMITTSLNKLFGKYIIDIVEGTKEGKSGIFIIIKIHKDTERIKNQIKELYSIAANQ